MPPENVRCPATCRSRNYIKNTLPKCYDPPPKRSELIESLTQKNGYRRHYVSKQTGLYRGWWKDNKRHGMGTQINMETKEVYEGGFHNDKRTGYGVISGLKNSGTQELNYEGDFANGAPNGKGELHTDTFHFIGQVIDGKASGIGIAWFHDGTIYSGTWFNGKRMGQGMQVLKNSNRYEGNWYDDKKHGFGQYCFFDRGQALEGVWVANVCVRGIMRNIRYRQAATNPVKYAIPKLMLKDWTSCYYDWEQEALARVGKYVREDLGIRDIVKEEELENYSYEPEENADAKDDDDISHQFDQLDLRTYSKYQSAITEIQPCLIFR